MKTGRPAKNPRPLFGERLNALREAAGLSQEQLASKLGIAQRTYSHWERCPVALRHEQIVALADALGISVAELMGESTSQKRGNGPAGRARTVFERVNALPRDRQQRILGAVEDMLVAHELHMAS